MGDQLDSASARRETAEDVKKDDKTFRRDYGELVNLDIDSLSDRFTNEDGIVIRRNSNAANEYVPQKVLYANKLNMLSAMVSIFFVFASLLTLFLVGDSTVKDFNGTSMLVCGIIYSIATGVFAVKLCRQPNEKFTPSAKPSSEFFISLVVTVILALLVVVVNMLFMVTDFTDNQQLYANFIAPLVTVMGIPVWGIVRTVLYKKFVL